LSKQGFAVEKSQIRMPQGPLKTVGDHAVSVALHTDVVVEVMIAVLGEHA
jgi:large subunit ribosomal protein L9